MLDSLKRKGGLFSEFYDKNRANLDLINAERRIKKDMAQKKTKK